MDKNDESFSPSAIDTSNQKNLFFSVRPSSDEVILCGTFGMMYGGVFFMGILIQSYS